MAHHPTGNYRKGVRMISINARRSLAFAAILVALFVSVYLSWVYTSPLHKVVCLGNGCDLIRSSPYAYPFGVPLPIFGVLFYLLMAALVLLEPEMPARSAAIWRAIAVLSGVGLLFSAWLTYLEAFVIHGWCTWCVTQALAVALAFLFSLSLPHAKSGAVVSQGKSAAQGPLGPSRRSLYAVLVPALALAIPTFAILRQHQRSEPLPPGSGQLIRPDSFWTGSPDAKLTIVEFGDFQCPACGSAEATNRVIRNRFASDIKFVYRHFPLGKHTQALNAAQAAQCAGMQGKFWPMADVLYQNQTRLTPADIQQYAAGLGLEQHKFTLCMDDPRTLERIRIDTTDGRALDVRATPTFFLNGKKSEGALDVKQVLAALASAR